MIMQMNLGRRITTSLLLLALSSSVGATVARSDFRNDANANYIFLFANDPGATQPLEFSEITFKNAMVPWNLDQLSPTLAIFSGPALAPATGRFRLSFNYREPTVSFQWAEVFFDTGSYTIQGAGDVTYDPSDRGGRWSTTPTASFSGINRTFIDDYFATTPAASVPLPSSVVLMLSAVAFIGFSRRGNLTANLAAN